jgi:hypothetical protein
VKLQVRRKVMLMFLDMSDIGGGEPDMRVTFRSATFGHVLLVKTRSKTNTLRSLTMMFATL